MSIISKKDNTQLIQSPLKKNESNGNLQPVQLSQLEKVQSSEDRRNSTRKQINNKRGSVTSKNRLSKFVDPNILTNKQSSKDQLKQILKSKLFDNIIIFFVIIFTIIVFVYFAIDTRQYRNNEEIQHVITVFQYIELAILSLFSIEIFLKTYAFTFQVYFQDKWLIFDMIIIVLSIILLVLDIVLNDDQFTTISKILRGIFRFIRLFLVFRKFSQFKVMQVVSSNKNFKSSVERIIEIMQNIKENVDDITLFKQINWCIEQIQSNKIYDPLLTEGEAAIWVNSYAKQENQQQKKKKNQTLLDKQLKNIMYQQQVDQSTNSLINVKYKPIEIPTQCQNYFEKVDFLDFDVFNFHKEVSSFQLSYLLAHLFQRYDIHNQAKIDPVQLWNWSNHVQQGYKDNYYHNNIHAFDVTQTVHYFLSTGDFINVGQLKPLEIGIMYIAAACHDYEHPGFNNPYLVNSKDELAIRYNDKSPLENHHSYSAFVLMLNENSNVLINFSKDDKKKSRERIINMILHTDNAHHFTDLAMLKGRIQATDFNPKDKDKDIIMNAILHAADISNPFKPFEIYKEWTERVLQEFWNQGDEEKERDLPVSYLCDRYTTNTAKCQVGFIDFVVFPLYSVIKQFLPNVDLSTFDVNKKLWSEQIDFYEQELKKLVQKLEQEDGPSSNNSMNKDQK